MTDPAAPPPPKTRRPWIAIAVGILIGVVLLAVLAVGSGVYWMSRHVRSQEVALSTAEEAFARERTRFAGQEPLVVLEDNRAVVRETPPGGARTPVGALHILAYDESEGRLVHVDVPGWLLRLLPGRNISIDDIEGVSVIRDRLTIADLERHGPGLVLDTTTRDGSRVLVWTE